MKGPENLGHWSRDSEVISSYILEEDSLSLTGCRKTAPIYQENDQFLENIFRR